MAEERQQDWGEEALQWLGEVTTSDRILRKKFQVDLPGLLQEHVGKERWVGYGIVNRTIVSVIGNSKVEIYGILEREHKIRPRDAYIRKIRPEIEMNSIEG